MATGDDRDDGFASPPCLLHAIDPVTGRIDDTVDPQQRRDVMRWRKAERARLIAARLAVPGSERRRRGEAICAAVERFVADRTGAVVSAYWPFRGEPDLRPVLESAAARGGTAALPVVVAAGQPLIFRAWTKGAPLDRGVWNIPVPKPEAETVVPDVVIAPVVGFDTLCYRLGYGGGFFDRTLAALQTRPLVIGVGYALAAIPTIFPQPHDIPMDLVVTEDGIVHPAAPRP